MTTTRRSPTGHPAGFTIAEMLVVMALSTVVMAAATSLMINTSRVTRTERDRLQMHESSRVLLTLLADDIRMAGASLDVIDGGEPVDCLLLTDSPPDNRSTANTDQRDDAITVRRIDGNAWTFLLNDVSATDDEWLEVADLTPFEVGDRVIVYDSSGDYDIREVLAIATGPDKLQIASGGSPGPLMKTYNIANSTVVGVVLEATYEHEASTQQITRQLNGGPAHEIARQVEDLTFTYYDGVGPTDTFVPADEAGRKNVLRVGLNVVAKSRLRSQITTGDHRRTTSMTSVGLRNRSGS